MTPTKSPVDPAAFAGPPDEAVIEGWREADREARPGRLERIRVRFETTGVDAYFGINAENSRYLTGFELRQGEDRVAGNSGQFLVAADEMVLLADTRYEVQAHRQAPDCRIAEAYGDLDARWPELVASIGARRIAVEAAFLPHATWQALAAAAPHVELLPVDGWVEEDRAIKEPAEIERIAAACAVADRALATLLPRIRPGMLEEDLALELEWLIRTGGAEALAFDVACLAGPEAALPHGSPGARPVAAGQVLLFDFGAQVCGYRSDMTRTLFVGEPAERDLAVYELVARAQQAALDVVEAGVRRAHGGGELPDGGFVDAAARGLIADDGRWPPYGHGLGHGIGLATHERPRLGVRAPETPLPSPTVFSVEPGIYLEAETGVRIEDLVAIDAASGRFELLTRFPREVLLVGG